MCGRRPRPMANDVWLPSSVDGVDGQRENQIESSWVDPLTFLFLLWRACCRGTGNSEQTCDLFANMVDRVHAISSFNVARNDYLGSLSCRVVAMFQRGTTLREF